jgi:hypothetical protein
MGMVGILSWASGRWIVTKALLMRFKPSICFDSGRSSEPGPGKGLGVTLVLDSRERTKKGRNKFTPLFCRVGK